MAIGRLAVWGLFSLLAVILCLLAEVIMLVCAVALKKPNSGKQGIGVLYVGDCAKV